MEKSIPKQIFSYLGIGLGTIGILLCLAVIIAAWWVNSPITYRLLYQVFPPIEAALSFSETTVAGFGDFLVDTQTQFKQTTDAKPLATALEDEIQQFSMYVNVAITVADTAEQLVTGVAESANPGKTGNVVAKMADRLSEVLTDVSDTLDSVKTLAQDIKAGRDDKVNTLNDRLNTLQAHTSEAEVVIAQTESDVAFLKSKVPRWINLGSMIVTLIFIWFGAAQYFLFRAGWQFLRKSRATGDEVSDRINALNEQIHALESQLAAFKIAINQDD